MPSDVVPCNSKTVWFTHDLISFQLLEDPAYIYRLTRAFPNLCIASLVVGPNIFIQILACLYKLCHQHTDLLGHIINYTLTCMPGVAFTQREQCVLNNRFFVRPCHIFRQCSSMDDKEKKE